MLNVSFFKSIAAVLFPRYCAGCSSVLSDEEPFVCASCMRRLRLTEHAQHRGNGLELLFRSFSLYSKEGIPGDKFVRGAAYAYYSKHTPLPNIIRSMKFLGDPELARWLGMRAAEHALSQNPDFFDGVDMLMPVALHPKRLRERGFNQSEWLCRGISDVTGIPVDTAHLVRSTNTEQQSLKTLEERAKLGQIFSLLHPEELRGKHIMIVDDVTTSGSTIARVQEVLHPIRNCRYSVFALAYAKHIL